MFSLGQWVTPVLKKRGKGPVTMVVNVADYRRPRSHDGDQIVVVNMFIAVIHTHRIRLALLTTVGGLYARSREN